MILAGHLLLAGAAMIPAQTPQVRDLVAAIEARDEDRLGAIAINARFAVVDHYGNVESIGRAELIDRLNRCSVSEVVEAGDRYAPPGVSWICRDRPVAGSPCESAGYGLSLDPVFGGGFRVRVYATDFWNRAACPNPGPAAPPAPRRTK